MGISMALFEETTYDPHNRCTNQQQPRRLHHDSERRIASVCAAITEAVHHATGLRVRELPVKIEDLLTWGGIIFLIAIVLVEIDIQTLGMH